MEITKEQFDKYEMVRKAGVSNMFDVNKVKAFSGLKFKEVIYIMRNYSKLKEKFNI